MIWFNIREAFQQLMTYGEVYTLRPFLKREGRHLLRTSLQKIPKKFVQVAFIQVIELEDPESVKELEEYIHASGFKKVEDWLACLKGDPERMYLHYVTLED